MRDILNKVTQGDCLEIMREIPDKSVDLIVIDPPYNIGKDKRWDKWHKVDDYITFMTDVFKECERVLKPNGSFYWFHNDMAQIRRLMDAIDSGTSFVYKQFIVWDKFNGTPWNQLKAITHSDDNRNYPKLAEYCLFYTFEFNAPDRGSRIGEKDMYLGLKDYFRGEKAKCESRGINIDDFVPRTSNFHYFANGASFNLPSKKNYEKLQLTGFFSRPYQDLKSEYEGYQKEYEILRDAYGSERYTFNVQKTHSSVWQYAIPQQNGHITPKPVDLIENIIRHSSNEGDIVLDCFLGSGTTAVAAINTGRQFIGIEREPEYVEIANKRISDALVKRV